MNNAAEKHVNKPKYSTFINTLEHRKCTVGDRKVLRTHPLQVPTYIYDVARIKSV